MIIVNDVDDCSTPEIPKDPDARLEYSWDWSDWLEAGETITTPTVECDDNSVAISPGDVTEALGVVTAWVSGGTVRTSVRVTCRIVTSATRQDDRSLILNIIER